MASWATDFCESDVKALQFLPHSSPGGMREVAIEISRAMEQRGREAPVLVIDDLTNVQANRLFAMLTGAWHLVRLLLRERPIATVAHAPRTALFVSLCAVLVRVPERVYVVHTAPVAVDAVTRRLLFALVWLKAVTCVVHVGTTVRSHYGSAPRSFREASSVIKNSVALSDKGEAPIRLSPPFKAIVSGRLVAAKRVDKVVAAFSLLRANCLLEIVGDGPESTSLIELADQLGVHADFLGHIDREDLLARYTTADLMLFPSEDAEALPLVLLEALSVGLPVISNDIAAAREVLGQAGVYVNGGPDEWTACIDGLLLNPSAREGLRNAALRQAESYSPKRFADAWESLLWS